MGSRTRNDAAHDVAEGFVEIARLGRDHVREAGQVLAESHHDYPSFRHLFPDPVRRRRALGAFFRGVVSDAEPFGSSHVAERADGKLLGVALWLPPRSYPWAAVRKLRAAPALLRVAVAAPGSMRDFARTGANTERVHPAEPHWYLEVLGVRPEAQRHRVGTQLLCLGLARAEHQRLPCYLETARPRNVEFYRRSGFEVVNDALSLVPDGPTHCAMWRAHRGLGSSTSNRAEGGVMP